MIQLLRARKSIKPSSIPISDETDVLCAISFIYRVGNKGKSLTYAPMSPNVNMMKIAAIKKSFVIAMVATNW